MNQNYLLIQNAKLKHMSVMRLFLENQYRYAGLKGLKCSFILKRKPLPENGQFESVLTPIAVH